MRRLLLAFVASLPLAACRDLLGPQIPSAAMPIDPLPVYAEWWRMTEQCSGRHGDFSRVEWFVMPGVFSFSSGDLKDVAGMTIGNRIVVAERFLKDGDLVRHEMLHALIERGRHPRADFIERCGLVVACEGRCRTESRAAPPLADAEWIPESQLEVSTSVWPERPTDSLLGGYFRLTISVRNPFDHPVIVQLEPAGDAGPPAAFRFKYVQRGFTAFYDDRAWWPEMTRFAAGERKDRVFDFWIERPFGMPSLSGTYDFLGAYGDHWAPPVSVTIQPPS